MPPVTAFDSFHAETLNARRRVHKRTSLKKNGYSTKKREREKEVMFYATLTEKSLSGERERERGKTPVLSSVHQLPKITNTPLQRSSRENKKAVFLHEHIFGYFLLEEGKIAL